MPTKPPKECSYVGCHQVQASPRCDEHTVRAWQKSDRTPVRGSRWRKVRARQLKQQPTCQACNEAQATEVDHVLPTSQGGAMYEPSNLQSLCSPCHAVKSKAERAALARGEVLFL